MNLRLLFKRKKLNRNHYLWRKLFLKMLLMKLPTWLQPLMSLEVTMMMILLLRHLSQRRRLKKRNRLKNNLNKLSKQQKMQTMAIKMEKDKEEEVEEIETGDTEEETQKEKVLITTEAMIEAMIIEEDREDPDNKDLLPLYQTKMVTPISKL